MKLILSGEGPTDMGAMRPTANGPEFTPGPMAWIVDRLIEDQFSYSQLGLLPNDPDAVRFVGKQDLARNRSEARTLFPGIRQGKGDLHFTRNAELLGDEAKKFAQETNDFVVAVLFRDSDGTRASPNNAWRQKIDSIYDGFRRAQFEGGVAMVPRPKSEAWLICALKPQPYQHCDALEDASGNDNSPNSLKRQLAELFNGVQPSTEVLASYVREGRVDPRKMTTPSFIAFRENLERVLKNP